MKTTEVYNILFQALEGLGAIKWHISLYGSCYLKFKDTRLGSVRIAAHQGREKYNYKYNIFTNNNSNIQEQINNIVSEITAKSLFILNFNSESYIVYDKDLGYVGVNSYTDYIDKIKYKKKLEVFFTI